MIKPDRLKSAESEVAWDTIAAAADGDIVVLRRLLERSPWLGRAEYWYTPAIHFAVREGQVEAVQLLLENGADPEGNGLHDGSLIAMARERGHAHIARLLRARRRRGETESPGRSRDALGVARGTGW